MNSLRTKSEFTDTLDQIHEHIRTSMQAKEDEEIANDLTQFFNAIAYQQPLQSDALQSGLKELFNQNLVDEIVAANPSLKNVFLRDGDGWRQVEQAVGLISYQALQKALSKPIVSRKYQAGPVKKIVAGAKTASTFSFMALPKEIFQSYTTEVQQEIQKSSTNLRGKEKYWRYKYRMGKTDVDMTVIDIEGQLSSQAEILRNLTFSVKHYADFTVHLESVNKIKAYSAIISKIHPNLNTDQEAQQAYLDYYVNKIRPANEAVSWHLTHLLGLYALTGYGTFSKAQSNKMTQKIVDNFSRFLLVNNYRKREIKVVSTKSIIQEALKQQTSSPFNMGDLSQSIINVSLRV